MANNPSSSSSLRFLGLPKQPGCETLNPTQNPDPLELNESDVVWSFAVSADADSSPQPNSIPSPQKHHRQAFSPAKSGLSAALCDDHHRLIRRKATVNPKTIPVAIRQEDVPPAFHQTAPVNVPIWPGKFRREYGNGDSTRFDELDGDDDEGTGEEEIVPPHVIVARSHVTFSVFEGVGRTLKGRDLRRLRNTVFQKTGFLD